MMKDILQYHLVRCIIRWHEVLDHNANSLYKAPPKYIYVEPEGVHKDKDQILQVVMHIVQSLWGIYPLEILYLQLLVIIATFCDHNFQRSQVYLTCLI